MRHNFSDKRRNTIVQCSVRAYREAMPRVRGHVDARGLVRRASTWTSCSQRFRSLLDPKKTPSVWNTITKARAHDSHQAFEKLCQMVDGEPRFLPDPPLVVPLDAYLGGVDAEAVSSGLNESSARTAGPSIRIGRRLVEQYRVVHVARKVVGVGSVGTEAWIALLLDSAHGTPLLLQIKQAEASVIERFTAQGVFSNHGHRVVAGQRLMQAASDIFLGWERFSWQGAVAATTTSASCATGRVGRHCRHDFRRAWPCGRRCAAGRSPAPTPVQATGWLSRRTSGSQCVRPAIAEFSVTYADQNAKDHAALAEAGRSGRIHVDRAEPLRLRGLQGIRLCGGLRVVDVREQPEAEYVQSLGAEHLADVTQPAPCWNPKMKHRRAGYDERLIVGEARLQRRAEFADHRDAVGGMRARRAVLAAAGHAVPFWSGRVVRAPGRNEGRRPVHLHQLQAERP